MSRHATFTNHVGPRVELRDRPAEEGQRTGGLSSSIASLDEEIAVLSKFIGELEARLGPISIRYPDKPTGAGTEAGSPRAMQCEIGERLTALADTVRGLHWRLSEINRSLDI